jgi:hypothetical protein
MANMFKMGKKFHRIIVIPDKVMTATLVWFAAETL